MLANLKMNFTDKYTGKITMETQTSLPSSILKKENIPLALPPRIKVTPKNKQTLNINSFFDLKLPELATTVIGNNSFSNVLINAEFISGNTNATTLAKKADKKSLPLVRDTPEILKVAFNIR